MENPTPETISNVISRMNQQELKALFTDIDNPTLLLVQNKIQNLQAVPSQSIASSPRTGSVQLTKLKAVKKGVGDSDFRAKIMSLLFLLLEGSKTTISCFFVIFVPQLCPPDLSKNDKYYQAPHQCTLQENLNDLTMINLFALILNFATCFFLLVQYVYISYRETFLIEYLDDDPTVPQTFLDKILPSYPTIQIWFHFYNRMVFYSGAMGTISFIASIVLSGFVIFRDYYSDFRSVTVFFTNLLMLLHILYRFYAISYPSVFGDVKAISYIQTMPVQFNQIDSDHVKDTMPVSKLPWYFKIVGIKSVDQFKTFPAHQDLAIIKTEGV